MHYVLSLWNIFKLICCKQELLGSDSNSCPAEENVEAICQFFNTIGKQLDENPKSRQFNDVYFNRMKELTANTQLAPRLRFMARDILDLRSNNWVPRREEVYVSQLHLEMYLHKCSARTVQPADLVKSGE